jgi:antitoxin (DNA-binding transcriptional repressor) of toxin-antitoxin stability system
MNWVPTAPRPRGVRPAAPQEHAMVANNRVEATGELAALADRLAKGETLVLTRQGKEIAVVTPLPDPDGNAGPDALRRLYEINRGVTTGGVSIKQMVEEGRE